MPLILLPFPLLLAFIALGPLAFPRWWQRFYGWVAGALGSITVAYYLFHLEAIETLVETASHYFSFIVVIGSLFVVSGGIHLQVRGKGTPAANLVFLLIGSVLANFLGTTGASMLLIRPWLRLNRGRLGPHHIVFFIFLVSNAGGALTPIGDPPLYFGYLMGMPFWWLSQHAWPQWMVAVGGLLLIFWIVDRRHCAAEPPISAPMAEPTPHAHWHFQGLFNLVFLGLILVAVFITQPPLAREALMLAAAAGSYYLTGQRIHQANGFTFHPLVEVATLFAGIFATMMPALEWLGSEAAHWRQPSVAGFYWGAGALSAILDNAPTYLCFLTALFGSLIDPQLAQQVRDWIQAGGQAAPSPAIDQAAQFLARYHPDRVSAHAIGIDEANMALLLTHATWQRYVLAISMGAVFFGACTYIGNGPNFMVKSIADEQRFPAPTFMGYILKYTIPFLLPVLAVVWLIFFRHG